MEKPPPRLPNPVISPAIPDSDMTPLAEIIIESADSNGSEGLVPSVSDTVKLSKREREALVHLAQGLSNREIAKRLGISINTVNKHVQQIFTKLNVRNRVQAATKAIELERQVS